MLGLVLLFACSGSSETPPALAPTVSVPSASKPTVERPAPASASATDAAAVPSGLAPVAADPAAFGDKVLVILSSSLTPGEEPAGLPLAATVPGASLARLDSTAFKGLMPCFEIVVAGAFADKAAATGLSNGLKAAGVDHYLKPAGAYVGARPELDRACAARREPTAPGEGLAFVLGAGARLPFAAEIEARAIASSPPVRPIDSTNQAWTAPLSIRTMEPWKRGDVLPGIDAAGRLVQCPLESFVKGVVGTPHFGWAQSGETQRPGCGEEHLYATVGCDALVVFPAGSAPVGSVPVGTAGTTRPADLPAAWDEQIARERVLGSEGGGLQEQWSVQPLTVGDRAFRLVQVRLWTGEGIPYCGNEDFLYSAAGLLDAAGQPALELVDTTGWMVGPALALDATGAPALLMQEELTGSRRLVGAGLDVGVEVPYCDCPC